MHEAFWLKAPPTAAEVFARQAVSSLSLLPAARQQQMVRGAGWSMPQTLDPAVPRRVFLGTSGLYLRSLQPVKGNVVKVCESALS